VTLSPTSLTFGSQGVGTTSVAQSIGLTNGGNAVLTISRVSTSGDFGQTSTCGGSLGAGASCVIQVTFTPTAAGQRTGNLSIADDAANSPQTVGLIGTGVSPSGGTPAGTYQIGIAGTSGTLAQSATVTLVVQ
jgi:hypothetical protein